MSKLDYFLFSYRKSQTQLCKLFLHVSQQNSINVCTSTKERSLFVVLVLRSTWFRYILSEVTAFIKSLALGVDSLELSTVHVFSVADIVFCLLQTECLALSAFFSFFPLSLKPTHASRWKDYLYLNGLVLFCDFHIHVQYKKQGQQQPPFPDQSISGHRCDID